MKQVEAAVIGVGWVGGTRAETLARTALVDKLHLCDIKVLHGQDQGVADELGSMLGLAPMAQHVVTGWAIAGKGRALWLVGDRPYKVQTVRTTLEEPLTFTNDAIANG